MIVPPIPPYEEERLKALHEAGILDTPPEREFDDIVALAAEITGTSMSLISLVDRNRQWFKARQGIDASETSRDVSFCAHAINYEGTFIIRDTLNDPRFHDNPYVIDDPNIRFYAGIPVKTHDGMQIGSLCVLGNAPRDISEREERALNVLAGHVNTLIDLRRAQEITYKLFAELHIRQDSLQRITDTATRMLSVIAHDVRGPLASIVSMLEQSVDIADYPWLIDEIHRQSKRATSLLDEILIWARTMIAGGPVVQSNIDIGYIAKDVVQGARKDADSKGTTITLSSDLAYMTTDPNIIRFVIHTLVTNAVKFTDRGTIAVRISNVDDGSISLEVEDSGVGMDEQTLNRLFDWKYRQSTRGTNNEIGTGMALLLVNDFLKLLHTTVQVTSSSGNGSTFTIAFHNKASYDLPS